MHKLSEFIVTSPQYREKSVSCRIVLLTVAEKCATCSIFRQLIRASLLPAGFPTLFPAEYICHIIRVVQTASYYEARNAANNNCPKMSFVSFLASL